MATRREREERAEYDRLHAKYGKAKTTRRPKPEPEDDDEDDGNTIILTGRQASTFMSRMFGDEDQADEDDEDQADDDEDDDEDDDDEDEDEEPEPTPRPSNKFFRGKATRG